MAQLSCPVRQQAIEHPDRIAVFVDNDQVTYAQLDQLINISAQGLKKQGLKAKDFFACCDENSLTLISLLFACLRIGVVFCPLNFRLTSVEKKQMLENAGIRFLWQASGETVDNVQSILIENVKSFQKNGHRQFELSEISIDARRPATIIFTSGSSGPPKAAVHSLGNHFYSALGSQSVIPLTHSDCWLASLPFFHIGGLAIVMRCFIAGASVALTQRKDLQKCFDEYPVSHASLVPTQLFRLLQSQSKNKRPLHLRYLLLGGAPLESKMLLQAKSLGAKVFQSYGLTEMASQVATCSADDDGFSEPLPYRQWQVIDKEIFVKGETLFLGYLVSGVIRQMKKDGWFHTGDVAEQSFGKIHIVGRRDNMFVCGGENYYPEAIEKIILSFPDVLNVVIVPSPDAEFGDIPIAFIEWRADSKVESLTIFLKERIAGFKIPRQFRRWQNSENQTLKINRKLVQQLLITDSF